MTDTPAAPLKFCRDCRWARPFVAHWFAKPNYGVGRCANLSVNARQVDFLVTGDEYSDGVGLTIAREGCLDHQGRPRPCGIEGKLWEGKA